VFRVCVFEILPKAHDLAASSGDRGCGASSFCLHDEVLPNGPTRIRVSFADLAYHDAGFEKICLWYALISARKR
jgi:hypothetical protein